VVLALTTAEALEVTAFATAALAIVTAGLAIATFMSVVVARGSLAKAQATIELSQLQLTQTQQEIALSRQEVEEAHRPVVVPIADHRKMDSTTERLVQGRSVAWAYPIVYKPDELLVPIKNVGSGPALCLELSVKPLDQAAHPSATTPLGPATSAKIAGLGVDVILPLYIHADGWREGIDFELAVTYEDVAGKRWATTGRYVHARNVYEDVAIARQLAATSSGTS
jgi:hypothetical protein